MTDLIDTSLLKIELIYKATGTTQSPGGQQAGISLRDIRITHLPSGIFVQVGAFRSQHKNRLVAMEMLETALTSKWADELK